MSNGIMWHFNPPLASHFGGIFKIMVKAMKRAMKAIIGQADLDEEEFRMAVSKMSYLINSRPIQVVSDVNDYEDLTHLIIFSCLTWLEQSFHLFTKRVKN